MLVLSLVRVSRRLSLVKSGRKDAELCKPRRGNLRYLLYVSRTTWTICCLGKSKRKWLYWKEEGPAFVRRRVVVFMRARDLTSALILHVLLRKSLRNNP